MSTVELSPNELLLRIRILEERLANLEDHCKHLYSQHGSGSGNLHVHTGTDNAKLSLERTTMLSEEDTSQTGTLGMYYDTSLQKWCAQRALWG